MVLGQNKMLQYHVGGRLRHVAHTGKQPRCGTATFAARTHACVCVYVHCCAALRVLYPLGLNGSAGSSAVLPAPVPPLLPACRPRPRNNELPMAPGVLLGIGQLHTLHILIITTLHFFLTQSMQITTLTLGVMESMGLQVKLQQSRL